MICMLNIILLLISGVFFFSGVAKLVNIPSFCATIQHSMQLWGISLSDAWLWVFASILIAVEILIAILIVRRLSLFKTLLFTTILLSGFSLLLIWLVFFDNNNDCGCFGNIIELDAASSLIKNCILLIICGYCISQRSVLTSLSIFPSFKYLLSLCLLIILLVLTFTLNQPIPFCAISQQKYSLILNTDQDSSYLHEGYVIYNPTDTTINAMAPLNTYIVIKQFHDGQPNLNNTTLHRGLKSAPVQVLTCATNSNIPKTLKNTLCIIQIDKPSIDKFIHTNSGIIYTNGTQIAKTLETFLPLSRFSIRYSKYILLGEYVLWAILILAYIDCIVIYLRKPKSI